VKTWGGRFDDAPDHLASAFGQSIDVDRELALDDVTGSVAWAHALARAGVLSAEELAEIAGGLEAIRDDLRAGRFGWDPALEDVHMNIEAALLERIGPLAGKLHTGRSRNDQVSTDLRLWLRRTADGLDGRLLGLQRALVALAQRHPAVPMPGHTHLQPAQPVLFAHHLLAYVDMLERDRGRLADARRRANLSPLGSGAIAGSGFPIDRHALAAGLGFDGVTTNSIDASGDRDFAIEALSAAALAMVHLSRMAEEIGWWSAPGFGFVRPADAFSTGSSMLPNKRNPDPAELVRGRAALVVGQLAGALALLKGLPLGYQRDLQEIKPLLLEGLRILDASLAVMTGMVETLEVNAGQLARAAERGHTSATTLADALVDEGVAFRSAHHVVGALVKRAEELGLGLDQLPDSDVERALADSPDSGARSLARDPLVGQRLRAAASVEAALARCDVVGGTAPGRVSQAVAMAADRLRR
jgi:argininosuccinate lyase